MRIPKIHLSDKTVELFATWFYIGKFPLGPGTLASFVGMLMCFVLANSLVLYVLVFLAVSVIGFSVGDRMEAITGQKDPGSVVIDEVAGIMIAFFLLPMMPSVALVTFFLFRAFDMFKVYPVNKFEELHGSVGIMMDDIIAGLYTCITMHIAIRWTGII